ncbi:MAG: hypothetical protein CM15mP77_0790 [Synechococcus sp.]|nr:MAG: hypothetical protein CM15mP77_0790 [Synechococcus sp.]
MKVSRPASPADIKHGLAHRRPPLTRWTDSAMQPRFKVTSSGGVPEREVPLNPEERLISVAGGFQRA